MAEVQAEYEARLKSGALRADAAQAGIVAKLDRLCQNLSAAKAEAKSGGFFRKLFAKPPRGYSSVKSLYLYGKVGRGKTMLMDLFYAALPAGDKRRAHFNDFMSDVQSRLAAYRAAEKQGKIKLPREGAFLQVAADIAAEAHILCFDEFSVTDIADAMILSRLFQALFAHGVVLVATSNVAPQDLYRNGLNRPLFLPFIKLLEEKAEIRPLDAPADYRLEQGAKSAFPAYLCPDDEKAKAELDAFWSALAGGAATRSETIKARGHDVHIPRAADIASDVWALSGAGTEKPQKAARFAFKDICGSNLSAYDYAALAEHYALFCVDNVPQFSEENRNEAKRFILLIDVLYDRHRPLCLTAAAPAAQLYIGRATITEKFEFDRTASRLTEMQSEAYLRACRF